MSLVQVLSALRAALPGFFLIATQWPLWFCLPSSLLSIPPLPRPGILCALVLWFSGASLSVAVAVAVENCTWDVVEPTPEVEAVLGPSTSSTLWLVFLRSRLGSVIRPLAKPVQVGLEKLVIGLQCFGWQCSCA